MPIDEQTLAELQTQCLANKEAQLSQTIPTSPRSFLRVESTVQAALLKSLEKRVTDAKTGSLAATAKIKQLIEIGRDYGITQDKAVATQLDMEATATSGSSIAAGKRMTSDSTGAYYTVNSTESEAGGIIEFTVTAEDAGEAANLNIGETLTFTAPITGVTDPSTVAAVDVTGEEEQSTASFRREVLAAKRGAGGGGNTYDYRQVAENTPGVYRAYPFSGRPIKFQKTSNDYSFAASDNSINASRASFVGENWGNVFAGDMIRVEGSGLNDGFYTIQSGTTTKLVVVENIVDESAGAAVTMTNASLPGDRTVFVESEDESLDRIPTDDLLDAVREDITASETGIAWPDLGDIDSTLFVEPITRPLFFVEVQNLAVDATKEVQCKAKVVEDLDTYFEAAKNYVVGLDFEMDRTDIITDLAISKVVQGVLESFGATAEGVVFYYGSSGSEFITAWQMRQGEVGKLGHVFDNDGAVW